MRFVIDMNLSRQWVDSLKDDARVSVHWSAIGDPKATDQTILSWAMKNANIVLTNDLDFGTLLALSHAGGPSVLLIRGNRTLPRQVGSNVRRAIMQYEPELLAGAIVTLRPDTARVRILPLT